LRDLSAAVLQFLDTTESRETSAHGRSVEKNAKSGSKTSSRFEDHIQDLVKF
jgi:hypothetical protein